MNDTAMGDSLDSSTSSDEDVVVITKKMLRCKVCHFESLVFKKDLGRWISHPCSGEPCNSVSKCKNKYYHAEEGFGFVSRVGLGMGIGSFSSFLDNCA